MEASKVTVSLHNPLLSQTKRQQLRREAIKALIQAKPYGKRITTADFRAVTHHKTNSVCYVMVENMVKAGEIVKHPIGPKSFFYTVPGKTKVTKPAGGAGPSTEDVVSEEDDRYKAPRKAGGAYTIVELKDKAQKFVYHYDSFSIKEFLKWLESQEA